MAPSLVQHASGLSSGSATTATITLGAAATAGNCLVAVISKNSTSNSISGITIGGVADNWASLTSINGISLANAIWADPNCAGGSTSVVVTVSSSSFIAVDVYEFSGVVTTSVLDQSSNSQGDSGSWTSLTTATTTSANEVWIGGVATTTASSLVGPASPWTNESVLSNTNIFQLSGYRVVSSTGTAIYNGTVAFTVWAANVVALFGSQPPVSTSGGLAMAGMAMSGFQVPPAVSMTGSMAMAPMAMSGGDVLRLIKTTGPFGAYSTPGTSSCQPGNTTGNLLVLFAAWDVSNNNNVSAVMPSSSVGDNSGNWWRYAGDSGDLVTGCRVAIWFCANALAITQWLSFSPQGITSSYIWWVVELAGAIAPYNPSIDFSVPVSYESGGYNIQETATAASTDFCFAIGAIGAASVTISGPGTGWTVITQGTEGVGKPNGISAAIAYGSFPAGTVFTNWVFGSGPVSQSSSFTRGASQAWQRMPQRGRIYSTVNHQKATLASRWGGRGNVGSTGSVSAITNPIAGATASLIVGITQSSVVVPQLNANFPVVRVEGAFSASPGNPEMAILDTSWTDLTSRCIAGNNVAGITVVRGQQYELSQPEAGTLNILMNNVDNAFDPFWPGSPYYSNALNANMSFQANIAPWTGGDGATLVQSSDFVFASGNGATAVSSMKMHGDGSTVQPQALSELVPITVNSTYSASAWMFSTSSWASGIVIGIAWYTAGSGFISFIDVFTSALAANTWTQATITGLTPPSNAAFAQVFVGVGGTPSSGQSFYIAEAALSLGSSIVETGLVQLGVPIRVSAFWQGRRFAVGYGYVERWPQTWPELRQWGFSPMVASDVVGVASSVQLPSAVQGEILADNPYFCFPFAEQYTTSQSTVNGPVKTPTSADGLIAINTSRINQQTATYSDGSSQHAVTGQSFGFLGDSGTGMGCSGYQTYDASGSRGAGATYGPDTGLPVWNAQNDISFEFWLIIPASVPNNETPAQGEAIFAANSIYGKPYIASMGLSTDVIAQPGLIFSWYWTVNQFATVNTISLIPSWIPEAFPPPQPGSGGVAGALVNPGVPVHNVLTITNGVITYYVNGTPYTLTGTVPGQGTPPYGNLTAFSFGQSGYSFNGATSQAGQDLFNFNYSMTYATFYSYALTGTRVSSHYSSGITGFTGDSIITRFGRYLAWGDLGLNPAGPSVTDAVVLGPAYSTAGAALSDAMNADVLSDGGKWFGNANGNLILMPRPSLYDLPSTVTFTDNSASIDAGAVSYEANLGFDYDNTYVENVVQVTLSQGPNTLISPVVKNEPSIAQYFQRGPLTQTVNTESLQDAFDRANWTLNSYEQPSMRVQQLSVEVASKPAAFASVLQTDIADIATVIRTPVGSGVTYNLPVIVEKVQHSIGPGKWTTQYQMSPYTLYSDALIADSSSTLGDSTLSW